MNELKWQQAMRIKQYKLILDELYQVVNSLENLTDREFKDLKQDSFKTITSEVFRFKGILQASNSI